MFDKLGNKIIRGTLFKNEFRGETTPALVCVGYDDDKVLILQEITSSIPEQPVRLTQEQLLDSQHIVCGFKKL